MSGTDHKAAQTARVHVETIRFYERGDWSSSRQSRRVPLLVQQRLSRLFPSWGAAADRKRKLPPGKAGMEIGECFHFAIPSPGRFLASCTALTVASWAQATNISVAPLVVSITWELAEARPKWVTSIDMELSWPRLTRERSATAERVADLCPIHATLKRATDLSRRIVAE
jgi:hypothetical protein